MTLYHFKECGLNNIYLTNGFTIEFDEHYGNLLHIQKLHHLHAAIDREMSNYKGTEPVTFTLTNEGNWLSSRIVTDGD